jgi:hypothetical protein
LELGNTTYRSSGADDPGLDKAIDILPRWGKILLNYGRSQNQKRQSPDISRLLIGSLI